MIINDDVGLSRILRDAHTIAVVGLSTKVERPSFRVAQYLQEQGYRIIPVHPAGQAVLGETCYRTLAEIPIPVDIVDCFRQSEAMLELADEAIAIGAKCLWMQIGVVNEAAAERAAAAGLDVVMDRCAKIEHVRLLG
ncbi:MAG: CoA-binding protein [Betaproteobacteria bacterium]|nr:CoA-binding protein [Betaproteobacteria bacterium]